MKNAEENLGYTPQIRSVDSATRDANDMSAKILSWMNIPGDDNRSSAAPTACERAEETPAKYYRVRHIWSAYNATSGSYRSAMDNLRKELPLNGWKVIEDGPVKSKAKQPQITARHAKTNHTLVISWHWKRPDPADELIYVMLESRCLKLPEGEDLWN